MSELPDPLTPADCDLRGSEPPWDLFVGMDVVQFGVTEEDAREFVNRLRAQYAKERSAQ